MKKLAALILTAALAFSTSSHAASPEGNACPNANILGAGLITKICWDCILPIVLFNAPIGGGSRPEAANHSLMCSCELGSTGIHNPGFSAGLRSVGRIMEVVRNPHCSPFLGGVKFLKTSLLRGNPRKPQIDTGENKIFMNVNSWSFPLLYMIEALLDKNCTGDATTVNLVGLSSFSPTWSADELSFHINPEASIFANPEMLFFGIADGAMINASPDTWGNSAERDTWFWAIGSWSSSIYPLTGNVPHASSPPRETALVVSKSLALSHRVGQSRKTMGSDNMCSGGSIYPMMPKSQYKISQIYPFAQASKNAQPPTGALSGLAPPGMNFTNSSCCTQLGETPLKWNEWRNMPGFEDYLYVIFRWTDCCINIL